MKKKKKQFLCNYYEIFQKLVGLNNSLLLFEFVEYEWVLSNIFQLLIELMANIDMIEI